jgi:anti-sigma factor RsiW
MSGCRHFVPLLEPFRDGELSPAQVVEVEAHLDECERCAERVRLGDALRFSLKEMVQVDAPVTSAFEERIRLAIAAEREREERMDPANDAHVRMLSWRSIMPIAAAAAVVMVWAASANNRTTDVASQGLVHNNADMTSPASVEKLLEDLVANHEKSVTQSDDQALLPQLEPEVGVPVKMPNFKPFGARWEGLSVVPVSNQRAASLRYRLAGHKLTVYIYDASRVPVRSTLQQRLVRNEPVYVGSRHGVSIAATERFNGVGYAVATDLNKDESAELVASIH